MTREIKFRVWTGLRMEYNIMAGWLGAFYVQGIDPTDSACMSSHNTIYSKQASVMQFTGLLDKNGKEIYESDLIDFGGVIFEVKYQGASFVLVSRNSGEWVYLRPQTTSDMEIIGNVYESN